MKFKISTRIIYYFLKILEIFASKNELLFELSQFSKEKDYDFSYYLYKKYLKNEHNTLKSETKAQILTTKGQYEESVRVCEESLSKNPENLLFLSIMCQNFLQLY